MQNLNETWFKLNCVNFRPVYPAEEMEEEALIEDDAELTLNKLHDELIVCSTY